MSSCRGMLSLGAVFLTAVLCLQAPAQDETGAAVGSKTPKVSIPEPTDVDVQVFSDHVTWLANPFLKGRLPGTPEMAMARSYIEHWFTAAGLKPAWGGDNDQFIGAGATSYRQPFKFGGNRKLTAATFEVQGSTRKFVAGSDFRGMVQGASADTTADIVFVGYGISRGKDDYQSFAEDTDLEGKIAMLFYFEPMNDQGKSLWRKAGWTRASSSFRKIRGLRNRGCAGVIMVIPPGVSDDRASLALIRDGRRKSIDCPVVVLTADAANELAKVGDPEGRDLLELRKLADSGQIIVPMKTKATLAVSVEVVNQKLAENVGGLIHGQGKLAEELIVVGAHIDHLGVGRFGSRAPQQRGTIHPGADDNASGAAALIMMAERLVKFYRALPSGAEARSVLFVGLDAEEQGLHGARHYTRDPLVPLKKHALMINFDMIGRITDHQLRLDGAQSGVGLAALIDPLLEASPLQIVKGKNIMMASDHAAFYGAGIPILFSIITPFHDDYHTPRDTSDKINAHDGARVVELYTEITKKVAMHPKSITFIPRRQRGARQ